MCPRPPEELRSDLFPDWQILEFAMDERMRPALALRAELVAEEYGMSHEELNKTLTRVYATLGSGPVAAIINPPVKA